MQYKGLVICVLLMVITGLVVERQLKKDMVRVGCLLLPNGGVMK